MKTIHKYPLTLSSSQIIRTHLSNNPLHVGFDPLNNICLWSQVETDTSQIDKLIFIVGTGHEIPPEVIGYVGSFNQGPFVWHVYIN